MPFWLIIHLGQDFSMDRAPPEPRQGPLAADRRDGISLGRDGRIGSLGFDLPQSKSSPSGTTVLGRLRVGYR